MMKTLPFRIVGGTDGDAAYPQPTPDDIKREAMRRLDASGYQQQRVRALATGTDLPPSIRHLALQIEFVAETLSRRAAIPEDFRSDDYWPALPEGTA